MKRANRMYVSACKGRNLGAGRSRVVHPASTATTSAALAGAHPKGRIALSIPPSIPALNRRTFDCPVSLD